MPFKSQAQRRKFAHLLVEGKISPETFEEWNRSTGRKELPDHVAKKGKKTKKAAKARKRTPRKSGVRKAPRKKVTRRAARKTVKRSR